MRYTMDEPERVRRMNHWIIGGVVVVTLTTVFTLLLLAPRLLVP